MGELANATIEFAGLFESSVAVPFADRTQASVSQSGPPPPPSTRRAGCVLETQPLAQAPLPRSGGGVGARPAQPRDSSRATSSRGGPKLKIDLHRGLLHQGAPQFISARAIERDLTLDSLALQSQPCMLRCPPQSVSNGLTFARGEQLLPPLHLDEGMHKGEVFALARLYALVPLQCGFRIGTARYSLSVIHVDRRRAHRRPAAQA